jgi:hypothetical protein
MSPMITTGSFTFNRLFSLPKRVKDFLLT